ncbi:MAG: glycyl-radical enzyme activating protein [Firmicutes bacterium]|nr:glycyl-radical enzyme activating protein [Bacillota bacterium]
MRFAIYDGPGIRTVVFLKGCPLSCWWCHNPEGQTTGRQLMLRPDRCIGCGRCLAVCERGAIAWVDERLVTQSKCQACFRCVEVCPTEARQVVGRKQSVDQVMAEIEKDQIFYDQSGGGVTFSGGEPLLQPDFLRALLSECRAREIHTAVETAGQASWDHLLEVSRLTDLFLYDLKLVANEQHIKYTGVSNRAILANLTALAERHNNIIIRIPVIPGINDTEKSINDFIDFLGGLRIKEIHLLPYHKTGEDKYKRLGRRYRMPSCETPSDKTMDSIAAQFSVLGRKVKVGG